MLEQMGIAAKAASAAGVTLQPGKESGTGKDRRLSGSADRRYSARQRGRFSRSSRQWPE